MTTSSQRDRWLLPRQQTEYPARDLLSEATLHARREVTFLVLAAMFFVAATALLVLGTSRVIDVPAWLAHVAELHVPFALLVPLGVVPLAASFVASAMVCELFGSRRGRLLLAVGLVASIALAGLMHVADRLDGGAAFAVSLALAASFFVAHACHLLAVEAMRRRARGRHFILRTITASLFAHTTGWCAFGFVLYGTTSTSTSAIAALAIGAAACSVACGLVLVIPAAIATRSLAVALRVGHGLLDDDAEVRPDRPRSEPSFAAGSVARRLPKAVIVDDDTPALQPFSSAEMRFFTEGDTVYD